MHQVDPELIFPMLVWDIFPRAGASQVGVRGGPARWPL